MATQDRRFDLTDPALANLVSPGRMTEEEFVAWCDEDTRAEWVKGEVVMMTPANVEHTDLSDWLVALLRVFVDERQLGRLFSNATVRLPAPSRRVPDLWFVAMDRVDALKRAHLEGPPDLAIEIVSPDSVARDWREKYLEYQAAGVREYWVIDPASRHVEAYALVTPPPVEGQPSPLPQYERIPEIDGTITSTVLTGLFLRTPWLWPETRPRVLEALRQLGVLPGG
jgi:Uma2 family endonuclease